MNHINISGILNYERLVKLILLNRRSKLSRAQHCSKSHYLDLFLVVFILFKDNRPIHGAANGQYNLNFIDWNNEWDYILNGALIGEDAWGIFKLSVALHDNLPRIL